MGILMSILLIKENVSLNSASFQGGKAILFNFSHYVPVFWASQVVLVVKNSPAGAAGDVGPIPGSERSPGGGHYSFLENAMDRGAWWATVRRVTKSQG